MNDSAEEAITTNQTFSLEYDIWQLVFEAQVLGGGIEESEFKFQSRYYIPFRTNTLILLTTDYIVLLLVLYTDDFGIK